MDDAAREELLDRLDPNDPMFYDRQGRPIALREYLALRADRGYRFLARDRVGDLEVLTVWLGLDQGPFADEDGDGPLIFGTAVVLPAGGLLDDRETFAATESLALANHAAVLAEMRARANG